MMKTFKTVWLPCVLMLFGILTAVMLTIWLSPLLHHIDVKTYHLDELTGLSSTEIARNYHSLANYLWLWHRAPLSLESFPISEYGAIHFAEVKQIVDILQIVWLVCGILGGIGSYLACRQKQYRFLHHTSVLMIAVPLALGVMVSVNFNQAFVIFHRLLFRNDYWIFDARIDPVINILPEAFFMHCFLMIIALVLLLSVGIYGLYRYQMKKHAV